MNKDRYVFILSKKTDIRIGGQSEVSLLETGMHLNEICFLMKDHSADQLCEMGSHPSLSLEEYDAMLPAQSNILFH